MNKKILVIGGAGYIGSVLVRHLLHDGWRVGIYDRFLYGASSIRSVRRSIEVVEEDTRNIERLYAAISKYQYVVHLGELVGDALCTKRPDETTQVNYLATSVISRMCGELGVKRLIYASSCSVYGYNDTLLYEYSPVSPMSLYADMKIKAEEAVINTSPATILRFGTVYGPSHRPRFDLVVNAFTAQAYVDKVINLHGGQVGAEQWRPFVHVDDIAMAIMKVLKADARFVDGHIFNVVGESVTVGHVAKMVQRGVEGVEVRYESPLVDPRNYKVSGIKILRALGFESTYNLESGITGIRLQIDTGVVKDYKHRNYYNHLAYA